MAQDKNWYEIVLSKIQERLPKVISSVQAEKEIKMFMEIIKESRISPHEKYQITAELTNLRKRISSSGHEGRIRTCLESLENEILMHK